MTGAQITIDQAIAEAAKRQAIVQVGEGASEATKRDLCAAVLAVAKTHETFTTAQVIVFLGEAYALIEEPRVLGAIMRQLQTAGEICTTGEFRKSGLKKNHNRVLTVWRKKAD